MSSGTSESRSKIRFNTVENIYDDVELKIKRRFGGGLFVDKYTKESDGVKIKLGNEVPKDVSDCRDRDRVINFISYKPIYTLKADRTENGYLIELPNRGDVYDGFLKRKQLVARKLDKSVAKSIYEELASLGPVQTQMSGIKDILWVVREKQPVPEEEVFAMRGSGSSDQTRKYLQVLSDIGFIRRNERQLYSGEGLDAHDQLEVESEEFDQVVLGQIVHEAYHTLKDELNLTLLQHYPKYAGSYYYSALKRGKPDLRLDSESITDNLEVVYNDENVHKYKAEKKMNELASVGVVNQDEDGMYYANSGVFSDLETQVPV